MSYTETKIIKIGSQELYDIGDRLRFNISEVMPHKGYRFKFGIRDRVLKEAIKRFKPLEIVFSQHPDMSFMMNPVRWMSIGEEKEQPGYFKEPMKFYWFYITLNGEITKHKQPEGQLTL